MNNERSMRDSMTTKTTSLKTYPAADHHFRIGYYRREGFASTTKSNVLGNFFVKRRDNGGAIAAERCLGRDRVPKEDTADSVGAPLPRRDVNAW
jgi:hypothetical protein